MTGQLQIHDPRERALVGAADALLRVGAAASRLLPARRRVVPPQRILLFRLERIGDLLMTLDAIQAVMAVFPTAAVDLVVGSWNRDLAMLVPGLRQVRTLDAPWLARGSTDATWAALARFARTLRRPRYDLAINFEGDIRSHALMALSGAAVRIGFPHAGGGPLLTHAVAHDPGRHTASNALHLVAQAASVAGDPAAEQRLLTAARAIAIHTGTPLPLDRRDIPRLLPGVWPRLSLQPDAVRRADQLLGGDGSGRFIGVHAGGGREIKQWHPARFGEAAAALARDRGATLVLSGNAADQPLVAQARRAVPPGVRVVLLPDDLDLVTLAAVLARLELFVTGDTGPMHLAAAMGTPIVAVFGPSMPWRYTPLAPLVRVVRIDLECSPCNRIRRPPERCRGHVPDCLEGIGADRVVAAGRDLLQAGAQERPSA